MARTNNLTNFLNDVSSAIKQKTGDSTPIPASEFDTEILSIETAGTYQTKSVTITENTTTIVTPDTGYDAIEQLTITTNVPMSQLQSKSVTITSNGNIAVLPDTNYDGMTQVNLSVNVPSSGDIKLFETQTEMQADPTAQEGDLAVVYRSEMTIPSPGDTINSFSPPATVVFDTPITSSSTLMLRGGMLYLRCTLSATSCIMMDQMGRVIHDRIQYTSNDGITYTRTDSGAESYDLGEDITISSTANTNILKFLSTGGMVFEGLYKYQSHSSNELIEGLINIISPSSYQTSTIEIQKIEDVIRLVENKFNTDVGWGTHPSRQYMIVKIDNLYRVYFGVYIDSTYGNTSYTPGLLFIDNKSYFTFGPGAGSSDILVVDDLSSTNGTTCKPYCYDVNIENETITDTQFSSSNFTQATVNSHIKMKGPELTDLGVVVQYNLTTSGNVVYNVNYILSDGSSSAITNRPTIIMDYLLADTQLNTTADYVYEKTFYGENGVEEGTLQQTTNLTNEQIKQRAEIYNKISNLSPIETDLSSIFNGCKSLETIPLLDTSNVTSMSAMFYNCTNLITIPLLDTSNVTNMGSMFGNCTSLTEIPQLNTSNVTNMNYMFVDCALLTTIPLLNTSNVTTMNDMFNGCTSLAIVPQLNTSNVTSMYEMFDGCTSLIEIPLLNTSNVTSMSAMFYNCTNLTTIPQLDTSNVTSMGNMFNSCTSLSNTSLNNILAMCTNATSYTSTKTLSAIGLTSSQATTCQSLSNYSAFIAAGWTTGY